MTKERKEQAITLLTQFQNGIVNQQGEAVSNKDKDLYNRLYEAWSLLQDIIFLIDEAPEDD